jgi:hypothetical protein
LRARETLFGLKEEKGQAFAPNHFQALHKVKDLPTSTERLLPRVS